MMKGSRRTRRIIRNIINVITIKKGMKMAEQKPETVQPPIEHKYNLELTENDKIALVNIINKTTFSGQDVEYVAELKVRVSEAPLSANTVPSDNTGDTKK